MTYNAHGSRFNVLPLESLELTKSVMVGKVWKFVIYIIMITILYILLAALARYQVELAAAQDLESRLLATA